MKAIIWKFPELPEKIMWLTTFVFEYYFLYILFNLQINEMKNK